MPLALTVTRHYAQSHELHVFGTIVASGNYTAGGDTLSLQDFQIKSSRLPIEVKIEGISGFVYSFIPGTDLSNGKMKVYVGPAAAGGALDELAGAPTAYPAGVINDTINFHGIFRPLV